jgi:tRNA (mo5U34)-methyltransferase
MTTESALAARRRRTWARELASKGWYHSFELPGGRVIDGVLGLEHLKSRLARFGLPEDLRGKRVLDIGAWDGWYSFEMEKRGAEVVAVDCIEIENFLYIHKLLGSKVDYRILDVFELSPEKIGRFDIVLFLGVLYHLRHPLLALEIVCKLTKELAIVESFVIPDSTGKAHLDLPYLEFYESDELGGQLDNWFGPTPDCLLGLCRAAGFAQVALRYVSDDQTGCVACSRQWEPHPPASNFAAPVLVDVHHCRNFGINFSTRLDDYLGCVFTVDEPDLAREDVCVQVGEYGAAPMWLGRPEPGRWQANCLLPPGIEPGWPEVRVRTRRTKFSNPFRIAVDLPLEAEKLVLGEVCDGLSWKRRELASEFVTFWIHGLPGHADRNNVRPRLGDARLLVDYISPPDENGYRQVNARFKRASPPGRQDFFVRFGEAEAGPVPVEVLQSSVGVGGSVE